MKSYLSVLALIVNLFVLSPAAIAVPATFMDSVCGDYVFTDFPDPLIGGTQSIVLICPINAGIQQGSARAVLTEALNFSEHIHQITYNQPGSYSQTFESAAPWNAEGARIEETLTGFASAQGNPGVPFHVVASLTGTFDGLTAVAFIDVTVLGGEPQERFFDFDFAQTLSGLPQGPHTSTLKVTLTGPGEAHFQQSAVSDVMAVPEPSTLALLGVACLTMLGGCRYRRRQSLLNRALEG